MTEPLEQNGNARPSGYDPVDWDTVMLSDIHLGVGSCRALELNEFLGCIIPGFTRNIYLLGDIFDGWEFRELSEDQKRVVDRLLDLAQHGVNIIYVPGNHDEHLRELLPIPRIDGDSGPDIENDYEGVKRLDDFHDDRSLTLTFNNTAMIEFRRGFVFGAADGKHYLVQHLDQFDDWMRSDHYLIDLQIPSLGSEIKLANKRDTSEIFASLYENGVDAIAGMYVVPEDFGFSAQKWLKNIGKQASGAVRKLRKGACAAAHGAGLDGAIGGHIHKPGREVYYASPDGRHLRRKPEKAGPDDTTITYLNTGDWKETCSALIFDRQGVPDIINWRQVRCDYGFPSRPQRQTRHPYQHMRPVTEAICHEMQNTLAGPDPSGKLYEIGSRLAGQAWQSTGTSASVTLGTEEHTLQMRLNKRVDNCIRQGIALNMPV